jgi:hypothetical protein
MVTEGLFVLLKAKTGRELDVENFLANVLAAKLPGVPVAAPQGS